MDTEGKVVYITGGSRGIGRGTAGYLLEKGYRVAISSRDLEAARRAAAELGAPESRLLPLQSDVRNFKDEQQAVAAIIDKWGRLDVLVANAGVGHYAPIGELSHEQWQAVIDTNITGVFNSTKAALEPITQAKGYIITISSLAGANFFAGGTAYNASKFAIVGFTQALMLDLRQQGVKVSTIMP
ncbi:MAG TPA: SDR family NAD(P)-dependent oxidoreductase, partial [Anseongella sp.]|nr:SDR family NAD(P)-dependent oxidoreductase [Anseongella sp.]